MGHWKEKLIYIFQQLKELPWHQVLLKLTLYNSHLRDMDVQFGTYNGDQLLKEMSHFQNRICTSCQSQLAITLSRYLGTI